jgi:hypothetical protein
MAKRFLVLCSMVVVLGCGVREDIEGETTAPAQKVAAFRALVRKYESALHGDVSINELRKHQEDVEVTQKQFIAMPFDFKNHPTEAIQIVELYLSEIEGNYDGQLKADLFSHIEPMWQAYHDDVKLPRRLLEKWQNEVNR